MTTHAQAQCKLPLYAEETNDQFWTFFDRYSHGFLFPSIVSRVKREMAVELERWTQSMTAGGALPGPVGLAGTPLSWGLSSVSTFGVRYTPPLPDLSPIHSVEALVEGSDMSLLREGT